MWGCATHLRHHSGRHVSHDYIIHPPLCICLSYFRGILYNIILNIKQSNTDSEIANLTNHIQLHQEKLKIVSGELKKFSDKLQVIEEDLSSVKEANEDLRKLKNIQESLSNYATSLRIEENFAPSGSSRIRASALVIIYSLLLISLSNKMF